MIVVNIAELKNNLSKYIAVSEKGEEITICKRNIPIAKIIPVPGTAHKNRTQLGCGRGSVRILSDLTVPLIPEKDWDMLNR